MYIAPRSKSKKNIILISKKKKGYASAMKLQLVLELMILCALQKVNKARPSYYTRQSNPLKKVE